MVDRAYGHLCDPAIARGARDHPSCILFVLRSASGADGVVNSEPGARRLRRWQRVLRGVRVGDEAEFGGVADLSSQTNDCNELVSGTDVVLDGKKPV
jgi:hypothetical protein